jgi:hypothetical protein
MSPKEKARELIEDFNNALTVKDCALVTINEIIDLLDTLPMTEYTINLFEYFQNVKKEIKKL